MPKYCVTASAWIEVEAEDRDHAFEQAYPIFDRILDGNVNDWLVEEVGNGLRKITVAHCLNCERQFIMPEFAIGANRAFCSTPCEDRWYSDRDDNGD